MQVFVFIGSDKNSGKTTAMGFTYARMQVSGEPLILTSVGLNGEDFDHYEGIPKPGPRIFKGDYLVTTPRHLQGQVGKFRILDRYSSPEFRKPLVLAQAKVHQSFVLEGPDDRQDLIRLKAKLKTRFQNSVLLIDGSLDRQFLAHPKITDGIYYSLLISHRKEQIIKAKGFLKALSLPACSVSVKEKLSQALRVPISSIILKPTGEVLYQGQTPPFTDKDLIQGFKTHRDQSCILYLNGALTPSLYKACSLCSKWTVVLDNFTLYQNIFTHSPSQGQFRPSLSLYRLHKLQAIFLKQEDEKRLELPKGVPVYNLFREAHHELGFQTELHS
jgi:hypothetical protein